MHRFRCQGLFTRLTLVVSFTLSGCVVDGPTTTESFVFDGRLYHGTYPARIPDADLTPLGQADQVSSDHIDDATVLAIRDVDPAGTVAAHLKESAGFGEPGDNVVLFVTEAQSDIPEVVCRYFDPASISSPFVCQSAVTVTFDDRRYVSVDSLKDAQSQVCGNDFFVFLPSELEALSSVDLDPRLLWADPDQTALALKGVSPETLIVLSMGEGFGRTSCVLVPEDATEVPFQLCPYYNLARALGSQQPRDLHDEGEPIPEGCRLKLPDDADARLDVLWDAANAWSIKNVSDYAYSVTLDCFCPAELKGPFTVRVSDVKEIGEVRRGEEVLPPDDRAHKWVGDVRTLFTYVALYLRAEAFEVRYHETYGFPTELRVDPSLDALDDEFSFEILEFEAGSK